MLVKCVIHLPSLSLTPGEGLCSSSLCSWSVCMGKGHMQENHRQNLAHFRAVILQDHGTKAADTAGQGVAAGGVLTEWRKGPLAQAQPA